MKSPSVHAIRAAAWIISASAAMLGVFGSGCGGAKAGASGSSLPVFRSGDAALFDDAIDGDAVGLAGSTTATPPLEDDPVLQGRAQQADVVSRMRVSTVTVDTVSGQPRYRLQLSPIGKPFAQRGVAGPAFEIEIRPNSPAFGIVKWYDTRLVGRTFIGFVRRFAGTDEPEIRFHLSADNAPTAAAVAHAVMSSR